MGKKLFIFCFTAVLAINGCIFNASAMALPNDAQTQQEESPDVNDVTASEDLNNAAEDVNSEVSGEEAPEAAEAEHGAIMNAGEDAGGAAENGGEAAEAASGKSTDNPLDAVKEKNGKSSTPAADKTNEKNETGLLEIIIRFLIFVIGFASGAVLIAAINNSKRKSSPANFAVSHSIAGVIDRADKVGKTLNAANAQLENYLSSSGGNSYSSDTQSTDVIIAELKSKISELEEKVSSMRYSSAQGYGSPSSAATDNTPKIEIPKTIGEMFNKVYELRQKGDSKQFWDYNESERKLQLTCNPIEKAEYVSEKLPDGSIAIYINKTGPFSSYDVKDSLFSIKNIGQIKGMDSFSPCIKGQHGYQRGSIG